MESLPPIDVFCVSETLAGEVFLEVVFVVAILIFCLLFSQLMFRVCAVLADSFFAVWEN